MPKRFNSNITLHSLQEDERINMAGILNLTVGSEPPRNSAGLSLLSAGKNTAHHVVTVSV